MTLGLPGSGWNVVLVVGCVLIIALFHELQRRRFRGLVQRGDSGSS